MNIDGLKILLSLLLLVGVMLSDPGGLPLEPDVKGGELPDLPARELLSSNNPMIREAVKLKMVEGGDAKELLPLLSSDDTDIASHTAEILGLMGAREAMIPLMLASQSPDERLRASAVLALGYMDDSTAVERLKKTLSDSSVVVRRNSAISLGRLGYKGVFDELFKAMADGDYSVRYSAEKAICEIDDTLYADILAERLEGATPPRQYHIISALGGLSDMSTVELLLALTESPDYHVRGFAFEALSHHPGDFRVANAMKKGLSDTSPFVRTKAADALAKLKMEKPL